MFTEEVSGLESPTLTKRDEEILGLLVRTHNKSHAEYTALQAVLVSVFSRGCKLSENYEKAARLLGLHV